MGTEDRALRRSLGRLAGGWGSGLKSAAWRDWGAGPCLGEVFPGDWGSRTYLAGMIENWKRSERLESRSSKFYIVLRRFSAITWASNRDYISLYMGLPDPSVQPPLPEQQASFVNNANTLFTNVVIEALMPPSGDTNSQSKAPEGQTVLPVLLYTVASTALTVHWTPTFKDCNDNFLL